MGKSCNNKSAKIKKGKSAKKVCIFKRCNNKSAKIKKASLQKKSAYSKDATTSLQKNKSAKSLHIQKMIKMILFLISQAKNQFKSAYFNIIIFPFLEING